MDAVGTLFGVRGSVGEIYSRFAGQFGVEVSADVVDRAFVESFKHAEPSVFPGVSAEELQHYEFAWWKQIAQQTFKRAGVLEQFADFDRFFTELYYYFSTFYPWFVYPDVKSALLSWKNQGIELGVISNFDSRLHQVLKALALEDFFSSVTISTEVCAAKPNRRIFHKALSQYGCKPHQAWHIGDSYQDDYVGATEAGLPAILLQRQSHHPQLFKSIRGRVWSHLQPSAFSMPL